jgi:hypothetical protein
VNLAVLRKFVPRQFVKLLWLAGIESGRPSKQACPSCGRPLLSFGPEVRVQPPCHLCRRCFLVWFDAAAAGELCLVDGTEVAETIAALTGVRKLT